MGHQRGNYAAKDDSRPDLWLEVVLHSGALARGICIPGCSAGSAWKSALPQTQPADAATAGGAHAHGLATDGQDPQRIDMSSIALQGAGTSRNVLMLKCLDL